MLKKRNIEYEVDSVRKIALAVIFLLFFLPGILSAAPVENIDGNTRCTVCGMFVAKYKNWITQVRLADGRVIFFDGVKDLMVFYFSPRQFGSVEQKDIKEIWVRDYYTLDWHDGRTAFYVVGSDVYGPMGKEFVPFASRDAAENFLHDHKGTKVLSFAEITDELVQSMRSGSRMRHGTE